MGWSADTEKRIFDDCECIQNRFFVNVESVIEVSGGGGEDARLTHCQGILE